MEINIRDWNRDDLSQIRQLWLDYCRNAARSDMRLKADADTAMKHWLNARFGLSQTLGFVAESTGIVVGFLIGRVDDWESVPPVIKTRRIGMIDAVYVRDEYRRHGIGGRLIDKAVEAMRAADAVAVETVYEAWNDASAAAWHRAGFAPWMVHVYRML